MAKDGKLKGQNLARGIIDIQLVVDAMNKLSPGAGEQFRAAIVHLSNRAEAQAGHHGTVAIAKQTKKDALGRVAPGIILDNDRVTGVAEPREGSDAINLDFFRRHQTCDELLQKIEDCLDLPTPVVEVATPVPDCWEI